MLVSTMAGCRPFMGRAACGCQRPECDAPSGVRALHGGSVRKTLHSRRLNNSRSSEIFCGCWRGFWASAGPTSCLAVQASITESAINPRRCSISCSASPRKPSLRSSRRLRSLLAAPSRPRFNPGASLGNHPFTNFTRPGTAQVFASELTHAGSRTADPLAARVGLVTRCEIKESKEGLRAQQPGAARSRGAARPGIEHRFTVIPAPLQPLLALLY